MVRSSWKVALSGDLPAIARAVLARPPFDSAPDKLQRDYKPAAPSVDWATRLLDAKQGFARWRSGCSVAIRRGAVVEVSVMDVAATCARAFIDFFTI